MALFSFSYSQINITFSDFGTISLLRWIKHFRMIYIIFVSYQNIAREFQKKEFVITTIILQTMSVIIIE